MLSRRKFIVNSAILAVTSTLVKPAFSITNSKNDSEKVRMGIIGVGKRGTSLMNTILHMDDVEMAAVCDLYQERVDNAARICKSKGRNKPKLYHGEETWMQMLDKEPLDAVIIATYWDVHCIMSLYAMDRSIFPGVEVPAALTLEDCWKLIDKSETTEVPCMMLENWSFRKDNLALLNMVREGMLGEIVHSHCAHSHDCVDHWFFDKKSGKDLWPAKYLLKYNRDQYPTHSVGPVLSWLNINRGDRFTEIYSISSASKGINAHLVRTYGKEHPLANAKFAQGDIVTSVLKTEKGKTVVVNYDMQLPRPYANRWMLQGTEGVYDEEKKSIYIVNKSPEYHTWEPWPPYEQQYCHRWWNDDVRNTDHGGADYVMLRQFCNAVKNRAATPLDVYDSMVMTALVPLSGQSIAENRPIPFPDFTGGKWKIMKPYFGL